MRFGIRVRVRVRDSAIFEKGGCGCGGTRWLKNIFIYIFNILLSIFFHIIQTYTKFKSNSEAERETKQRGREHTSTETKWVRRNVRSVFWISVKTVRSGVFFFFFFLNFGRNRLFRLFRPIPADSGRFRPIQARVGPNRLASARVEAESARVGASRRNPRGIHVARRGCGTSGAASVLPKSPTPIPPPPPKENSHHQNHYCLPTFHGVCWF